MFTYQTSTESFFDSLRFLVDGSQVSSWSGFTGPSTVSFPLTVGPHTLRWTYDKDGSVSSGLDTVWIDLDDSTVHLTWRGAILDQGDVEQIRMHRFDAAGAPSSG